MRVHVWQSPGKNHGLHFYEIEDDLKMKLMGFLRYHNGYLDAKHFEVVKASGFFFQGDQPGWLFIEFWSHEPRWRPVVELLQKEFALNIVEGPPEEFHG